jgi:SAM-dependent methyltransferase
MNSQGRSRLLSDLADLDWDFADASTDSPYAQLHWHPARFPPQIPAIAISALSVPGDRVLDPFCGSGTTLVEALRRGRSAVGIDTNPVATLIASAKTATTDLATLTAASRRLIEHIENDIGANGATNLDDVGIPNLDEQILWYERRTLAELGRIWAAVSGVNEDSHRLIFTACFSAILLSVCSQEEHWGWICDNVRPKVLHHRSAISKFTEKLHEYLSSATEMPATSASVRARVITGPCAVELVEMGDETFDLVVTSPPYFGVTDYAKAQRLTFLWLDLPLEPARQAESGARSKRHRQTAREQYLEDMARSFEQIARVLKRGSHAVVVIGQSSARKSILDELASLLGEHDLELTTTIHRRLPRQRAKIATMQSEQVWILRRG